MKNISKTLKNKKLIAAVVVIVLIGIGSLMAYKTVWAFTPAFSQRQTTQQFLSDISKNNSEAAYALTSSNFQSSTSYDAFLTQSKNLSGQRISVKYSSYFVPSKGNVAMNGLINDKTFGEKLYFDVKTITTSSGPKIDAIVIAPSSSN